MADANEPVSAAEGPIRNPWPFVMVGLVTTLFGVLLAMAGDSFAGPPRWGLLRVLAALVGLIAVGLGVVARPRSPAVLFSAAFCGALAYKFIMLPWDSAQLVVGVLTCIALAAFFLYLPEAIDTFFAHDRGLAVASKVGAILAFTVVLLLFVHETVLNQDFYFMDTEPVPPSEIAERGYPQPIKITLVRPKSYLLASTIVTVCSLLYALVYWNPPVMRRVIVSLIIVFHFGGILTAITSIPSRGGQPPWLPHQLWVRIYRPYLQFMYLNNAYHFYSPEPGPPTLLWFRIEYTDGSSRWIKIPNKEEHYKDPLGQQYFRLLALTDQATQSEAVGPSLKRLQNRHEAGVQYRIPLHRYLPEAGQFRQPNDTSRRLLRSYCRHVAQSFPHDDPALDVKEVKLYKVIHQMLHAPEMIRDDRHPLSKALFHPYYMGTYDKEGNLIPTDEERDPFLYWMIPIIPELRSEDAPVGQPFELNLPMEAGKTRIVGLLDCLTRHAGSSPWPRIEGTIKSISITKEDAVRRIPAEKALVVTDDGGDVWTVHLEPNADVLLNFNYSQLDQLQPGDRVDIEYEERSGALWASEVRAARKKAVADEP